MKRTKINIGEGGEINYIKPGQLQAGTTIVGVYQGLTAREDQFGKKNHRLIQADGSAAVINSSGKLDMLLEKVPVGSDVEIIYLGKTEIQSGPHSGKQAHNFDVFITDGAPAKAAASSDGVPF